MVAAAGCVRCGTSIGPGQRFCAACGTPVPVTCPSCRAPVAPDTRFCPHCGAAVAPRSGPGGPFGASEPSGGGAASAAAGGPSSGAWGRVAARLQDALRGEFVIKREIGRGGMAAVYLAHELRLDRPVALKVMSPALLSGDGMVERFRQEATIVAKLSHANIVTVHAVREIDDLCFFVMRFVEGRSLDHVLRERGRLPLPVVRALLFEVGSALAYAHRRGVVHRDIKPGNILVDVDGRAVVTDFGIAKVAESSAHTQTGMLIGTPAYMSAEQCRGVPASAASDQYSLGVVAYELLTGRKPFTGDSLAVLQQHVGSAVPPFDLSASDCPPDVVAVVERMLAKDPAMRWPGVMPAVVALGGAPLLYDDPLRDALAELAVATPHVPAPSRPQAVRIALSETDLEVGDVAQASAEVLDQYGAPMTRVGVEWASNAPDRLAVDQTTARLTALAAGPVTLRASAGAASGEVALQIAVPRPVALAVAPPATPLRVAERWRPVAAVHDRRGRPIPVPVTIESSAPAVAAVAQDGLVEGRQAGRVVLRFTCAHLRHDVGLDVAPAAVRVRPVPSGVVEAQASVAAPRTRTLAPFAMAGVVLLAGTGVWLKTRSTSGQAVEAGNGAVPMTSRAAATSAVTPGRDTLRSASPTARSAPAPAVTPAPGAATVAGARSRDRAPAPTTPPSPAAAPDRNVGAPAPPPTRPLGNVPAATQAAVASGEGTSRKPPVAPQIVPATALPTAPAPRAVEPAPDGAERAAAEARTGMQRAITAYVDAVSARSPSDMVRVFPSMPPSKRHDWEALFSTVSSVEAHARSVEAQPKGNDAGSAQFLFSFSLTNPVSKQRCTQDSRLLVQLARSAGVWRIVELTQLGTSTYSAGCG